MDGRTDRQVGRETDRQTKTNTLIWTGLKKFSTLTKYINFELNSSLGV